MTFKEPSIVVVNGKTLAEAQEAKCQQWMIDHVPGYCAERWAEIYVGPDKVKRAFYVDSRVEPALTKLILDTRVNAIDAVTWKVERIEKVDEAIIEDEATPK